MKFGAYMNFKSYVVISSSLLFSFVASAQQSDGGINWKTACTKKALKKEFKIDDPNPFQTNGDCSGQGADTIFGLINGSPEDSYRLFYWLSPKCVRYES